MVFRASAKKSSSKKARKKTAEVDAPPTATDVKATRGKKVLGWREWVRLPDLNVGRIKAKVDTGARTSCLHAFEIKPFTRDGHTYVNFVVHPVQRQSKPEISCTARVVDYRGVTDSGGRVEQRYVICTDLKLGASSWEIELTLTNRDQMGFRMLIGRQALKGRYLVDPGRSFIARRKSKKATSKSSEN
jgi:hypothetical protein